MNMLKFYAQIAEIGKDNILYACFFDGEYYIYFVRGRIVMEGDFDGDDNDKFSYRPYYGEKHGILNEYKEDLAHEDIEILISFNKTLWKTL